MPETLRQRIIREREFARPLAEHVEEYVRFLNLLLHLDSSRWHLSHFHELVVRSNEVETFLDDYGARNNKEFAFLTELVASLRGLGKAGVALKHLMGRFPSYQVGFSPDVAGQFFAETQRTARFLNRSIKSMARAVREELERVGVDVPDGSIADATVRSNGIRDVLPHNIDEADVQEEEQKIAEIATKYLEAVEVLDGIPWPATGAAHEELSLFVRTRLDEETARELESRVHSLQSKYDTYVKATAIERGTPELPKLRGHVSLALHLLEMATELLHFYLRHENDVRYEPAKERISQIVDKSLVLDRAVHFAMRWAATVLIEGVPLAKYVLERFVRVSELQLVIPEGAQLHARPISLIVKIVDHYGTHVEMMVGDTRCNASSIMEMIMAVGNNPDADTIVFRGDARPLKDLELLFQSGLGEGDLQRLPDRLRYLA